ncbi:MAG: ABC transporter ATP-binding protein [Verrucomicrobia bacterium]|nr:ABC transporter ATP-binding protein [Verrucomicrobiota bacterium]
MNQLRRVLAFGLPFLWPYRNRFLAGVALALFFGLTNGAFVLATKTLFERLSPSPVSAGQVDPQSVTNRVSEEFADFMESVLPRSGQPITPLQAAGAVLFLPLLMALRAGSNYLSAYSMTWVSARVVRDMQLRVLEKLHSLSLDYFSKSTLGDLTTHISGDTRRIFDAMNNGFADLIKEPFTLVSILAGMFIIDARLTLAAMVILPLVILPILVVGNRLKRLARQTVSVGISQGSGLIEALSGIRLIKAYGLERFQLDRYRGESMDLVNLEVKKAQAGKLVNPVIEVVSTLGLGVLILVVFATHQSVSDFVGFLTGMVMLPNKFFAQTPSVREPAAPARIAPLQKELALEKVFLDYGHDHVLQGVDLRIPKGFKLGLAGPSGSGKSSLINLLPRFYDPTQGRILWDGRNLRDFSTAELRREMALVSQDVILFDASVADNIALGRDGATQAEIEEAARQAFADHFIRNLPRGYQTRVGERGVLLSGGQKARISLARAFLRNAPILILDEATAALDAEAETEVQKAIDRLEEGRTVVCIAHRLATLANMDEIAVLEGGKVVERGSYGQLLSQGGLFSRMAAQQGLA